ncbi:hypothetical protein [Rathayibacter soli]|uniref:hypothetical protein n=1 Tax=Rathayibacter soli TaxID=3144168 RepID=UPI0027E409E2|nr:hypothetical protein [Glaciibacter superstes]
MGATVVQSAATNVPESQNTYWSVSGNGADNPEQNVTFVDRGNWEVTFTIAKRPIQMVTGVFEQVTLLTAESESLTGGPGYADRVVRTEELEAHP